jgi:hypothetical protein
MKESLLRSHQQPMQAKGWNEEDVKGLKRVITIKCKADDF